MEVSMAQMQNVLNLQERFGDAGYTGYADFSWFLFFTILPDPFTEHYFEVKATLFLEGTIDYSIESLPVQTTYGKITLVFPSLLRESSMPVNEAYMGVLTTITNHVDQLNNSINITLIAPVLPAGRPQIRLNSCTISQDWIIGARNILIVEPAAEEAEGKSDETMSASQ